MRKTGMSRRVDDLGRIVIPAEMRRTFGIKEGNTLDISVDENSIIFTKREEACVFCGLSQDLKEFKGRMVCLTCIGDLTGGSEEGAESFQT